MRPEPRFLPAGDRVLIAEYGDRIDESVNTRVHLVARALMRAPPPGLVEVVPTYRSVAIHFDPLLIGGSDLRALVLQVEAHLDDLGLPAPRTVDVPVVYGGEWGPDLADVAAHTGMREDEVVAVHAGGSYRVYMMGFTPGFPYLGGMSPDIAAPRLGTPRTHVPAGSVGIAAQQTGIYPTASPGGWRLIGRTPLRLFDPTQDPPALLDAGDVVRFVPIDAAQYAALEAATPTRDVAGAQPASEPAIDVLDGGMLTTVQDIGRVGYQRSGVPVAGAMDTFALRAGNRLVGNDDDAAGIEMTLIGPTLRLLRDVTIAVTGADLRPQLNGRVLPCWRQVSAHRGDTISFAGQQGGLRAYLAVRGGISVPPVLGSRSTYLASALGGHEGRALREGDRLALGPDPASPPAAGGGTDPRRQGSPGHDRLVRVVLGPQDDAFTETGCRTLLSASYVLSVKSDRVGCRFDGPVVEHRAGADIVSDGNAFGSVQVAGDGQPIVLMADRGTTGGYTKIATVISSDLGTLAQMLPGDRLRFSAVSLDEAVDAARRDESALQAMAISVGPWTKGDVDDVFDEDQGARSAADGVSELATVLAGSVSRERGFAEGLRAGMTGQVVDVLVAPGQTVVERQTLLVIEAMKMQNPIQAPRAGIVSRVRVSPGEFVTTSTVVVEFNA